MGVANIVDPDIGEQLGDVFEVGTADGRVERLGGGDGDVKLIVFENPRHGKAPRGRGPQPRRRRGHCANLRRQAVGSFQFMWTA